MYPRQLGQVSGKLFFPLFTNGVISSYIQMHEFLIKKKLKLPREEDCDFEEKY
jgi:hypothetical protein